MTQHFIFLNSNLGKNYTGIESSALKRSKLFIEKLNIIPIFVTMSYNLSIDETIDELKRHHKIPKAFRHVNLYQFYQNESISSSKEPLIRLPKVENIKKSVKVIKEGKKYITKFYNTETRLISYIHYHNDNGVIYRLDNFNSEGFLSRVCVFKPNSINSKERISEFFYRADGTLCFQKFYIQQDGIDLINKIIVNDEFGIPIQVYDNEEDFTKFLLEFYLNKFDLKDQLNVIVDRKVHLIDSIKDNILPNLKIIPVVHSYHLQDITNAKSKLRSFNYYIKNIRELDGLIILTEQQRQDIVSRFGDYNNTYCIPHVVDNYPPVVQLYDRTPFKAIAVGRFSPEKNYDLLIKIFARVVGKIPTATLDLYGHGPLKKKLDLLIKELDIENNIKLNPFTKEIYNKFSTARLSFLTSDYEGFGLVVMESLACGCPVISYDIHYGPSAMINNGENGYLIEKNDEATFVEKIVRVLSDEDLNDRLSKNAYESAQRFSEDNIAHLWQNFINRALT